MTPSDGPPIERSGIFAALSAEARSAAVLARVAAPIAASTPPHRYLAAARGLVRSGPFGAAAAFTSSANRTRTALIDDRGSLTYAELDQRSTRLADAFYARGVRTGTGVGLLCRNHRWMVEALFAAGKLGAGIVLLNTEFSGPALAEVCAREGIDLLVHDDEFAAVSAAPDLVLGRVRAWTDDASDHPSIDSLVSARHRRAPRVSSTPRIVLLTSGTTGTPKGAPRGTGDTRPSLTMPAGMFAAIPFRARQTVYVTSPFFHAWGLGNLSMALALGSTIVTSRSFDAAAVLVDLERHQVDALITVPTLLQRLVRHLDETDADPRLPLRIVATSGSALPPSLARSAAERLGPVVHNLYGSTEVGYVSIAGPADLRDRPGTVGRPPLGTVIRILDEDGRPLPRGVTGRIFADSGVKFAGYTGGGTKEHVDGLISTGDLGHLDADGFLFVDGRADDMIVSGGENVFPGEVEECLREHPAVADVTVVGVTDTEFGQRLTAYVVATPGVPAEPEVLRDHVRSRLARFKVPREVTYLDEIPRNPAGKVVGRLLPAPEENPS